MCGIRVKRLSLLGVSNVVARGGREAGGEPETRQAIEGVSEAIVRLRRPYSGPLFNFGEDEVETESMLWEEGKVEKYIVVHYVTGAPNRVLA